MNTEHITQLLSTHINQLIEQALKERLSFEIRDNSDFYDKDRRVLIVYLDSEEIHHAPFSVA